MIRILPKGSTLPVTPKGNVKRKEAISFYAPLISQLYSNITNSSTKNSSQSSLSEHIRSTLATLSNTPPSNIKDHTTFYDLGIDSRLALSLRSSLNSYLSVPVSLSMIFENPTISKLVPALTAAKSKAADSREKKQNSEAIIQSIITKLEACMRAWPPRSPKEMYKKADKEVILLTGATGTVGTALLEVLAASPSVDKVYAMIRGANPLSRLRASFKSKGLDASILDSGKIEAVDFCMRDPLLGLDVETYYKLAKEVTIIVQNAWKMDFNLSVEEFEDDCLFSEFTC
jgi:acyl carrier protein